MAYTIQSLLSATCKKLQQACIDSARLDARILLQHATGFPLEIIIGYPEREVTEEQSVLFQSYIERRAQHEPIAYILGNKEFYGREFIVNEHTLIPRPDTETLIDAVLKAYPDKTQPLRILDVGTGSGCIILTLLAEYPNATGVATDISEGALKVAKQNARLLNTSFPHLQESHLYEDDGDSHVRGNDDRVIFLHTSYTEGLSEKFDIIVSNPPYVSTEEPLMPDVMNYEPHSALFADSDGLTCYRELAKCLPERLKPEGKIFLELGQGQEIAVSSFFSQFNSRYHHDLSGIVRIAEYF